MQPASPLRDILLDAYRPCPNFGLCREARWDPASGQIPRGFLGATGRAKEVEVIMVFAEPGHPHGDEAHDPSLPPAALMDSALRHTHGCHANRTDPFHANVRWFLGQLYPGMAFKDQLRRVWMTEGRLCSIEVEIGATRDRRCASHYLARQIAALPQASVVAFGGKAQHYLKSIGIPAIHAYALAPPGANHRPARPSWEDAIAEIRARRR